MRKRKDIIAGNQVSQLYTFQLGGYPQKVLLEGKQNDLPVVITLHGGPGTPVPFSVGCRGLFPVFTDRYIMVYWDQLGCGINNYPIADIFSVKLFVEMTRDLIREIKNLFPNNRLYLFSMSWGSVLSALVLEQTNQVDGVLSWGQVTHSPIFNERSRSALEQARIPAPKLDALRHMDPISMDPRDQKLYASCLMKYTDAYMNHNDVKPPIASIIWGLLTSPDYRFKDFLALQKNGYCDTLTPVYTLIKLDLRKNLRRAAIPYRILQGDTDVVTPTAFVQELVASAENPNLTVSVVSNSGHFPQTEGMNAIADALTELTRS